MSKATGRLKRLGIVLGLVIGVPNLLYWVGRLMFWGGLVPMSENLPVWAKLAVSGIIGLVAILVGSLAIYLICGTALAVVMIFNWIRGKEEVEK